MKYLGRTQDGKPLKSVKENISIITMDLGGWSWKASKRQRELYLHKKLINRWCGCRCTTLLNTCLNNIFEENLLNL